MTNVLPTWLRVFRLAAFAFALLQIVEVTVIPLGRVSVYLFILICVLMALIVSPWFNIPQAWIWWLLYCLVILISCLFIHNIFTTWMRWFTTMNPPFRLWSLRSKISVVYGTFWAFFLIVQIFVLPLYRRAFMRSEM